MGCKLSTVVDKIDPPAPAIVFGDPFDDFDELSSCAASAPEGEEKISFSDDLCQGDRVNIIPLEKEGFITRTSIGHFYVLLSQKGSLELGFEAKLLRKVPSSESNLKDALKSQAPHVIERWIENGGAATALSQEGTPLLHYAVRRNDIKLLEYLLLKGAEVNAKDQLGDTALHVASSEEGEEAAAAVALLLARGAAAGAEGAGGATPLHWACGAAAAAAVAALVAAGACPNRRDWCGRVPAEWALACDDPGFVRWLVGWAPPQEEGEEGEEEEEEEEEVTAAKSEGRRGSPAGGGGGAPPPPPRARSPSPPPGLGSELDLARAARYEAAQWTPPPEPAPPSPWGAGSSHRLVRKLGSSAHALAGAAAAAAAAAPGSPLRSPAQQAAGSPRAGAGAGAKSGLLARPVAESKWSPRRRKRPGGDTTAPAEERAGGGGAQRAEGLEGSGPTHQAGPGKKDSPVGQPGAGQKTPLPTQGASGARSDKVGRSTAGQEADAGHDPTPTLSIEELIPELIPRVGEGGGEGEEDSASDSDGGDDAEVGPGGSGEVPALAAAERERRRPRGGSPTKSKHKPHRRGFGKGQRWSAGGGTKPQLPRGLSARRTRQGRRFSDSMRGMMSSLEKKTPPLLRSLSEDKEKMFERQLLRQATMARRMSLKDVGAAAAPRRPSLLDVGAAPPVYTGPFFPGDAVAVLVPAGLGGTLRLPGVVVRPGAEVCAVLLEEAEGAEGAAAAAAAAAAGPVETPTGLLRCRPPTLAALACCLAVPGCGRAVLAWCAAEGGRAALRPAERRTVAHWAARRGRADVLAALVRGEVAARARARARARVAAFLDGGGGGDGGKGEEEEEEGELDRPAPGDATGRRLVHRLAFGGHAGALRALAACRARAAARGGAAAAAAWPDLGAVDARGWTGAHWAAAAGQVGALAALLAAAAAAGEGRPGLAAAADRSGATPLQVAAAGGRLAAVRWLVEEGGAPAEARAAQAARSAGHAAVAAWLDDWRRRGGPVRSGPGGAGGEEQRPGRPQPSFFERLWGRAAAPRKEAPSTGGNSEATTHLDHISESSHYSLSSPTPRGANRGASNPTGKEGSSRAAAAAQSAIKQFLGDFEEKRAPEPLVKKGSFFPVREEEKIEAEHDR